MQRLAAAPRCTYWRLVAAWAGLGGDESIIDIHSPAQPSPAQLDQDGSLNVIWQKVHFCGEVRCSAGRHSTPASQQREVC